MKEFIKQKLKEVLLEQKIPFDINIPPDIMKIAKVFKANNYSLYVVGGAVRDALLHKVPKDFDLATNAVPDEVEKIMKHAGFRTLGTGKAFGVINVFTQEGEYEIATFREDLSGGRRPDAVRFTDIQSDVKRRDLTINALFYDIDTHEIVDLVGGVNDLKNGVVRTVGNPEDRFGEDRLRIMRAIRFAGRFGSNLDPATDAALQRDSSLEGISPERIRDEFLKGIRSAKSVVHFLSILDKYHLFDWIFKGLKVNKDFVEDKDVIIQLACLLKQNNVDKVARDLLALKYSTDIKTGEIPQVSFLLNLLKLNPGTAVTLKKMQANSGVSDQEIATFGKLEGIDPHLLQTFISFKLTVSGKELIANQGFTQGKELGQKIQSMELQNFQKMLG